MSKEAIRDMHRRIIGYSDTRNNGDKFITDVYGHILGRYDKAMDVTRDFYGKIIAKGDQSMIFLADKFKR